jgi:spore maturation protein CgeB
VDIAQTFSTDPGFFYLVLAKEISGRKRRHIIQRLAEKTPVCVFGDDGWRKIQTDRVRVMGPAVYPNQTAEVYASSLINLGIERVYNGGWLNMRVLDIMACGGFPLSETTTELLRWFSPGKDVECFSSENELTEEICHYLANPAERIRIAVNGQRRVMELFTLRLRLTELIDRFLILA